MQRQDLLPHLFRTEFTKITAVLCKHFGIDQIEIAEDIASDTFLAAAESWPYKGIPENPTAWLYAVAKNKTKNHFQRNQLFRDKISPQVTATLDENFELSIDWSDQNIIDSQLQMLFAICHPSIPGESQVGLALRILCGFGIDEIANAFLTNKETLNKRLHRAKEKLRQEKVSIEFPGASEINNRIETVLTTLYLLFNEGYYSESNNNVIREDLCLEAMRLTYLLIDSDITHRSSILALLSLMCFQSSRFPARKNELGEMILYEDQDESLWNKELINKGIYFLNQSSRGNTLSRYHLEASIAYWHTFKSDHLEKWENILLLYNHLLQVEYSRIAALNRTFALSKVKGKKEAIKEAEKLQLTDYHYYYVLLGELNKEIDEEKSHQYFLKAHTLAKTQADKNSIAKRYKIK
ncbi:MAG: DUF6596 domain-containing protein [Saprospiraceae bacterium]